MSSSVTLSEWLSRLELVSPTEIVMGLERMHDVLGRLDACRPPTVLHVGGTNGKGSSVAMLTSLLGHSGYRTGAYTSPHLLRYNERIAIDGRPVSDGEIIRAFEKVRNHFGMSRASQAGALAALQDDAHLERVRASVARSRDKIAAIARDAGLLPLPSATNFVTIDCRRDAAFARAVLEELVARDIFVRMPFAVPGNRCIRISCGTDADLELLEAILPEALAAAQAR